MKKQTLQRLTMSAMMIALSTVLSVLKLWQMPLGGAVTPFSMLPVCLIGIMYGTKYALAPCFLYGVIQMLLSSVFGWGLTPMVLIGVILFDYIFAFTFLCLSGLFRNKKDIGIILGVTLSLAGRFLCHFVSGSIFFKTFEVFGNPYIYSLAYNGTFMACELVLTLIGAIILVRIPIIRKTFNI